MSSLENLVLALARDAVPLAVASCLLSVLFTVWTLRTARRRMAESETAAVQRRVLLRRMHNNVDLRTR
jgi:hypothetical protein